MANRFPLIINTTSGNSVQELPSNDFLDLSNSGISNSGNIAVSGIVSATGNITGSYILGNGSQLSSVTATAVGTLSSLSVTGTATVGNVTTGGTVSATGNITGSNILTSGLISATGGITSAGNMTALNFNSASADLAENYESDADYAPGTVVVFGGAKEITISDKSHNTAVAGIVSTAPSYLMNVGQSGEWVLPVALTGRVPCLVKGPVSKGTVLVTGQTPGTATALDASKFEPGCVVGKSLEIINSTDVVTIEVAVGRL